MFGLAHGFYQNYLKAPEVSILVVGLDGAGKTALLERLKVTDFGGPVRRGSVGREQRVLGVSGREWSFQRQPIAADESSVQCLDENQNYDNSTTIRSHSTPSTSEDLSSSMKNSTRRKKSSFPTSPSGRLDIDEENVGEDENSNNYRTTVTSTYTGTPNSYEETQNPNCSPSKDNAINDLGTVASPASNDSPALVSPVLPISEDSTKTKIENSYNGNAIENTNASDTVGGGKEEFFQHDLKKGKNMLPLHKIRPTLGMNLGKLEACGAKVRVMDLGGSASMRPLWERYYVGTDAVVFVIDCSPNATLAKLLEARALFRYMRDDEALHGVPVLIFANKIDEQEALAKHSENGESGKSDHINSFPGMIGKMSLVKIAELFFSPPRGSSSNPALIGNEDELFQDDMDQYMYSDIALCGGSAKTGEGIRVAFDWLIPKAKAVQKERQLNTLNQTI